MAMMRSFTRPLWLAGLVLVAGILTTGVLLAANTYSITVTAGNGSGLSPSPVRIGESAVGTLTGTASTPTSNVEGQLTGPSWSWTVDKVWYSPTGQANTWRTPSGGAYRISINQPDPASPNATVSCTFNAAGVWHITFKNTCTYTDAQHNTWSGSGTTSVSVIAVPGPGCGECTPGGITWGSCSRLTALDGTEPGETDRKLANLEHLLDNLKFVNKALEMGQNLTEAAKNSLKKDIADVLKDFATDTITDALKELYNSLDAPNLPPTSLHDALDEMIDLVLPAVNNFVSALEDRLFNQWMTQKYRICWKCQVGDATKGKWAEWVEDKQIVVRDRYIIWFSRTANILPTPAQELAAWEKIVDRINNEAAAAAAP